MSWANRLKYLFRRWLHRGRAEADLDAEVQSYFDTMVERGIAEGLEPEQARRAARLAFGPTGQVKENVREARFGATVEGFLHDVQYALRNLRKSPGFAFVAILSLGLGLGANTAIFTLVYTVMLKSLPVQNPERLVFIDSSGGKEGGGSGPPYPCYRQMRDNNHFFSGMAALSGTRFKVTIDGAQEQIRGQLASGSYFQVLGVGAVLGRVLTPADDSVIQRGGPDGPVGVISYGLWERRFGRNPAVLGKTIQVDRNLVTIVGVTPPSFTGLSAGAPVDLTLPMMLSEEGLESKGSWWFSVVGRLRDGASAAPAEAELDRIFQDYKRELNMRRDSYFNRMVLVPAAKGSEGLRRRFSKALLIVMTIAGLVLLIGCANVANLLLARASARRPEIALRLAIGAGRPRIVRQLFTEGLLLAVVSAGAGILFARWGVSALVSLFAGIRGRIVLEPHIDGSVLGFMAAAAVITSILFSIAPALHAVRTDAAKPGGARGASGAFPFRAGNVLVVTQITLSLVLLCSAALFLRSLRNLTHLDAGFQRDSVLTMRVDATLPDTPPRKGKEAEEQNAQLGRMWEDLLQSVSGMPQVKAVSASTLSPMSGRRRGVGMRVLGDGNHEAGLSINHVTAGFFDALGIRLIAGRKFTPTEGAGAPRVVILNETAGRRFFGGDSPLGRIVTFPKQRVEAEFQVVGLVRDTRYENPRKPPEPMAYIPIEQAIDPLNGVTIAIRSGLREKGGSAGLIQAVRSRMQSVVPGGFLNDVATVQQQLDDTLLEERLLSILASLFGVLALLLAGIGLYGIMSFTVVRRTRELGIRIAIGAQRGRVLWMILRSTLALTVAGLAIGIPVVVAARKEIESELFELRGTDPAALAAAALVLTCVALAAGYWPAWRASRLDPMASLRQD